MNSDNKNAPLLVTVVGESHVGLVRSCNEDSFCCINYPDELNALAVVADGIGGHGSGEIASELCCRRMANEWNAQDIGSCDDPDKIKSFILNSIKLANTDIYRQNVLVKPQFPMGCTIVCAFFTPDKIFYAHAGDSRLYRCRNNQVESLTVDHTLLAEYLKKHTHAKDDPPPASNIICKALGPVANVIPDFNFQPRLKDDRYLLCSDGLTGHLNDDEIGEILSKSKDAKSALNLFMRQSLLRGGHDNITAICVF